MVILALNPDEPEYSVKTETLGSIDVLPLTVSRMKALDNLDDMSAALFVDSLLAAVGRKEDGSDIKKAEAAGLTDSEREAFAEAFLEHNQYLFRERVTKRRKNEEGEVVVSFDDGEIQHLRNDDETAPVYLLRVFKLDAEKQREQMRKMMAPFKDTLEAHKKLFTPSFLNAFKETQSSQARLQDMVKQLRPSVSDLAGSARPEVLESRPPPIPDLRLPENPAYDTNRRLSEVVDRLEEMNGLAIQTAETVGTVSKSASEFLVAFGAASDNADRSSRRAIWIAGAAIVVAVLSTLVQIGYAEWRAHQNHIATEQTVTMIVDRMEEMIKAEQTNTQQLSERMNQDNLAVADSLDRLSSAISGFSKSLSTQDGSQNDPAGVPETSE